MYFEFFLQWLNKFSVIKLLWLFLGVAFIYPASLQAGWEMDEFSQTDGLCEAITADGVTVKMKRYRPNLDTWYNTEGTPVVLFPSIVANMFEFMSYTPSSLKKSFSDMTLPDNLAEWAQNDSLIESDPLRYYSLAYYLWKKGYDPWFANYRGTGWGNFRTENPGKNIFNLDVWANLDAPAAIERVIELTGKKPFIGGHSTGGLVCYLYLSGAYMVSQNPDGEYDQKESEAVRQAFADGYVPHVKFDAELARRRNAGVRGFIGLDPAVVPPVPGYAKIFLPFINTRMVIPFDGLLNRFVNPFVPGFVLRPVMAGMFSSIHNLDRLFGEGVEEGGDPFGYMYAWNVAGCDPCMTEFMTRFGTSDMPMRGMGQYMEMGWCHQIREHWKNGKENKYRLTLGDVERVQQYACYDDHIRNITVPMVATLSYYDALVTSDNVVDFLINGKTPTPMDEWCVVPDTAHLDIIFSRKAPTHTFTFVGQWLDKMENPK